MASSKIFNEQLLVPFTGSTRNHKLMQLPNGLLTLIISDPSEDMGSVALCVASGSHNDPDEIPGLAHFCEHLLLLGSENFPNLNEFHDILSKAGGSRNAFTTGEQTCFFLEAPSNLTYKPQNSITEEPIFNYLLKMLADSFKCPLFPESMFEREIHAIEDEHTKNKSASNRILFHGLRLISNPKHKFHRFATGNFFTLNDLPKIHKLKVRDELIKYFNENYSPEKMTLVIKGSQSLNQLTKLVITNFGDLKQHGIERKSKINIFSNKKTMINDDSLSTNNTDLKNLNEFNILSSNWNYENHAFTLNESNNCIFINRPKQPLLRLFFPLVNQNDSSYELFKTAMSNVLGDEGKGSLHFVLKSNGYSTGLCAYSQNLTKDDDVLVIEIKLSSTGVKRLNEVISSILTSYKSQVFNNPQILGRYLYELESIDLLNYLNYENEYSSMQEVSYFAQNLQKNLKVLGSKNILKGSGNWNYSSNEYNNEFWTYQGDRFLRFVNNSITVDNLRVALLSEEKPSSFSSILIDSELHLNTDNFFNFDYTVSKFHQNKILSTKSKVLKDFQFPIENHFIPNYALNHNLLREKLNNASNQSSSSSLSFVVKQDWSSTKAELTKKTNNFELWTKIENSKLFSSKIFISFDIITMSLEANVSNTMCTEIVAEILKSRLLSDLYSLELLNYTWEVTASSKGDSRFSFTLSGYLGGIDILLDLMISTFNEILQGKNITKDEFRKARVCVRSRYKELEQNSSLALAVTGLLVVLEDKIWGIEDRLDSLDDMDINEFKVFLSNFASYNDKYLKLLIHGNSSGDFEKYETIINKISNHQSNDKIPLNCYINQPSTFVIPEGHSFSIERKGGKKDPTNAISFFIQTGFRNDEISIKMTKLLSYLMSLTLIPDLRMNKQLGYAVLGGTRVLRSTIGIHISIMSGTFTPQYLEKKINEYLSVWEDSLNSLNEKEFESKVIEPYLKNFKKSSSSGGIAGLSSEILPSVGSANCNKNSGTMKLHKQLRDLILNDSYNYISSSDEEESFINSLTKENFLRFFNEKLSFKKRSQLSIMIRSQLTKDESQQQLIRLQLEAFLKMNCLRISTEKLEEIITVSKCNSMLLMKELFKYFIQQGESLKLVTVVTKEIFKQVSETIKMKSSNHSEIQDVNVASERIEDLKEFQKKCRVYYLINQ